MGGGGWFRGGMGCVYSLLTWEMLVGPIVCVCVSCLRLRMGYCNA